RARPWPIRFMVTLVTIQGPWLWGAALLGAAWPALPAQAHPLDMARVRAEVDGPRLIATVELDADGPGAPDRRDLAAHVAAHLQWWVDGSVVSLRTEAVGLGLADPSADDGKID